LGIGRLADYPIEHDSLSLSLALSRSLSLSLALSLSPLCEVWDSPSSSRLLVKSGIFGAIASHSPFPFRMGFFKYLRTVKNEVILVTAPLLFLPLPLVIGTSVSNYFISNAILPHYYEIEEYCDNW